MLDAAVDRSTTPPIRTSGGTFAPSTRATFSVPMMCFPSHGLAATVPTS
jgi:hypothetical protein